MERRSCALIVWILAHFQASVKRNCFPNQPFRTSVTHPEFGAEPWRRPGELADPWRHYNRRRCVNAESRSEARAAAAAAAAGGSAGNSTLARVLKTSTTTVTADGSFPSYWKHRLVTHSTIKWCVPLWSDVKPPLPPRHVSVLNVASFSIQTHISFNELCV